MRIKIISFKHLTKSGFSLLLVMPTAIVLFSTAYTAENTEITEQNNKATEMHITYIYDKNGNTIAMDETKNNQVPRIYEYGYNGLNQMVGFTNVQNNEYYGYDYYPDGRRSAKYTSSQTGTENIAFLYGHKGNLLNEEYSQNSQLKKRSSYFAGIRFVDDLINSNDSIFQLPLADRHNHPATISFNQGQSHIQSYHLTDYGQLSQANNSETNQVTQTSIDFSLNSKVYGSGYYDPESKLQYMGARYYSADSHRFMAQDSYNLLNRYNYANANPVMNYDPDGHKSVGSWIKGAANSAWKTINSKEGIYTMNSVGAGLSLLSAPFTGASSLLMVGALTGTFAGGAGIGAQLASDYSNNRKLQNALNITATTLGIVDIGIGVTTSISTIYNASKEEKIITKSTDIAGKPETATETAPNKYIIEENGHKFDPDKISQVHVTKNQKDILEVIYDNEVYFAVDFNSVDLTKNPQVEVEFFGDIDKSKALYEGLRKNHSDYDDLPPLYGTPSLKRRRFQTTSSIITLKPV